VRGYNHARHSTSTYRIAMLAMCSVDAQRGLNCLACVFFQRLYFSVASQRLSTLSTFSVKVAFFFFPRLRCLATNRRQRWITS